MLKIKNPTFTNVDSAISSNWGFVLRLMWCNFLLLTVSHFSCCALKIMLKHSRYKKNPNQSYPQKNSRTSTVEDTNAEFRTLFE